MERLGVVGFGTMGSEIALLGACAGLDVRVYARGAARFEETRGRLARMLRLLSRDPKFFAAASVADDAARERTLEQLTRVADLDELADCTWVIESAAEDMEVKRGIFATLDSVCSPDALLATNTSSISITQLGAGTTHPERVVGMHFFNPPTMMQLVEVIPGAQTDELSLNRALELAGRLGRRAVRVNETPGFIVNRVLVALMNEAIRLHADGVASIEDIDEAMKLGAGFPLGPFKLCDLVGLDVFLHTCESIHGELGEAKFAPPPLLRELVAQGRLGRKSRHGFYKY